MEICIAVADWARGPMTWVLDAPGGEGTGEKRRTRKTRTRHVGYAGYRASPSGSTGGSALCEGQGAEMVAGWG
ncbi:hypothetical protein GCM10010340_06050 [Streptomyces griseoloalbus]|nr:hypothetical protein GCM10010294_46500 [Streptomyces griseoloalbus]GGW31368.1 hypothetical protein GCM10010340_06050 [Streptomyces albaduncus]